MKKKKPGKNPDVDTSFLPDKDREVQINYWSLKSGIIGTLNYDDADWCLDVSSEMTGRRKAWKRKITTGMGWNAGEN